MSQSANTNFLVVKFVKLPGVLSQFTHRCIHRSWIVSRESQNVFVACPRRNIVSSGSYTDVSTVFSASVVYETDDMEDGIRFVYEKFAEYVEKQFPERCNGVRSVLQRLLEVVPPK